MKKIRFAVIITLFFITACAMADEYQTQTPIEKKDLIQQSADFLVPLARYSTEEGRRLYDAYKSHLNTLGLELLNIGSVMPVKQTFGFYYDSKIKDKDKLYIGFDCELEIKIPSADSYPVRARNVLFEYVHPILHKSRTLQSILQDANVHGVVISFYWQHDGQEGIIIWLEKKDIVQFMSNKIIYPELIARSTTTKPDGKIINVILFQKAP